jgi:hypothetical protein
MTTDATEEGLPLSTTSAPEKEWRVHVFRRMEKCWQKVVAKNSKGQSEILKAAPRQGSIVIRRLQVRIKLLPTNKKQHGNSEHEHTRVNVVRRRQCILITSSNPRRVLMLRFHDLKSCLEFSDHLVSLNPPPERAAFLGMEAQAGIETVFPSYLSNRDDRTNDFCIRQILSYVGSLLHDPDFAQLVKNLEKSITSSEDGVSLLAALTSNEADDKMMDEERPKK